MDRPDIVVRFIRASLRGLAVAPITPEEVVDLSIYVEKLEIDNRRLRETIERLETSAKSFTGYNFDKADQWRAAYTCLQNIAKDAREILGDWTGIS